MARPALHVALQILSVLAQRIRRRRREIHQDLHHTHPRRDRIPRSRAGRRSLAPPPPEASCQGDHHHGPLRRRLRSGRRGITDTLLQSRRRSAPPPRRDNSAPGHGRRAAACHLSPGTAVARRRKACRSAHRPGSRISLKRRNAQDGPARRTVGQQRESDRSLRNHNHCRPSRRQVPSRAARQEELFPSHCPIIQIFCVTLQRFRLPARRAWATDCLVV